LVDQTAGFLNFRPGNIVLVRKPVFGQLESEEKIGNLIVDVGSGVADNTATKNKTGKEASLRRFSG
jgi:hypothetical protein